ncbi:MAG: zf-HC2 domain-containing protein [Gemmatimonadaceae bacterium]
MNAHISWDTLNDLADGLLPGADRERADRHLHVCPDCTAALADLRSTVGRVAELANELAPPDELWSEIRSTIDARKVASLRTHGFARARGWWMTPRRLAVAAVTLIVLSSGTTAVLLRQAGGPGATLSPSSGPGVLLPASWQSAERGYLASVEELREQVEAQRDRLSPSTIAAVEQTLATIDVAIAEARAALLRDPANAALSELLASNYRQKVELLRRAAQLDAST